MSPELQTTINSSLISTSPSSSALLFSPSLLSYSTYNTYRNGDLESEKKKQSWFEIAWIGMLQKGSAKFQPLNQSLSSLIALNGCWFILVEASGIYISGWRYCWLNMIIHPSLVTRHLILLSEYACRCRSIIFFPVAFSSCCRVWHRT